MPKFGDLAECQACGTEIQWIGSYWEHTTCNPRHIGKPKTVREPPAGDVSEAFEEVLRNDTLVAALWQLGVPLDDVVVQMAKRYASLMGQVLAASAALSHRPLGPREHRLIGDPPYPTSEGEDDE